MGCRKYKGRQYYDDLTGQTALPEDLEEMAFVFDGEALVIDLDEGNAQAFRDAMAPFVRAARPTSKAKVLSTLPRKRRHLSVVPSPVVEDDPQAEPQNAPETQKGQTVEARTEPEGTQVPETPSNVSNSRAPEEPAKPVLKVVPPPRMSIPDMWAPMAPERNDDQRSRVFKARKWATQMAIDPSTPLTPEMFQQWNKFYAEQGWLNL